MIPDDLTGTNYPPDVLIEMLLEKGLQYKDAATVTAKLMLVTAGSSPRVFQYKTSFASAEATCTSQFARSFVHADWVDGADVVQAEQTTGEEGFNLRFHRIEDDLDALAEDVARAFVCLANMRTSLRALLDEIRAEINIINAALADRPAATTGGATLMLADDVKYVGTTNYFGHKSHVVATPQGNVVFPITSEIAGGPLVNPRVRRTALIAKFLQTPEVKTFFNQAPKPVTPTQFNNAFGDKQIGEGYTVRAVLSILSSRARFDNSAELVERVAEREAAALRTTGESDELIREAFGLVGNAKVGDAPVDRLTMIPAQARTALNSAGYNTVKEFTTAGVEALTTDLKQKGLDVNEGDVAGWQATALTFNMVR